MLFQILSCVCFAVVTCCSVDDQESSLDLDRLVAGATLVIAGYTRAVFQNTSEFLVFNTLKGEDLFVHLLQEKEPSALESALSRRMVNVSGFDCRSNVKVGETYILFLNVDGQTATSTGHPLVVYSRDKEEAIREIVGSLGLWKDWGPCSKTCGSGTQERKRNCSNRSLNRKCSIEDGQERTCNSFSCIGIFDVLEVTGFHRPEGKNNKNNPSTYFPLRNQTWTSGSLSTLHRAFPLEFGLLLRCRPSQPGVVFQIMSANHLQFGLRLGRKHVTLILSNNVEITFDSVISWSNTTLPIAFSFRRNTVTFYQNCKSTGSTVISAKLRPLLIEMANIVLGSTSNNSDLSFEGTIEQLIITESPEAAAKQCSSIVRPLMHLDSPSKSKTYDSNKLSLEKLFLEDEEDLEEDEDTILQENGSGLNNIEKAIPLISEDDEHFVDDEDIQEMSEDWNTLLDDERTRSDTEGSGWGTQDAVEWSDWSACSHTCGWGTRSRTSFCRDNTLDLESCSSASNTRRETETCFLGLCQQATVVREFSIESARTTTAASSIKPTMPQVRSTTPHTTSTSSLATSTSEATKLPCPLDCGHGGLCNAKYTACQCPLGYYGKLCQHVLCVPNCQNRGVCVSPNKCICPVGYSGKSCERGEPEERFAPVVAKMEVVVFHLISVHVRQAILENSVRNLIVIPRAIMEAIV